MKKTCLLFLFIFLHIPELPTLQSQTAQQTPEENPPTTWDFDAQLQIYFAAETEKLSQATVDALTNMQDGEAFRTEARQQLLDMLGLHPMSEKTPLKATVTGTVEHDDFVVEKLHFQSMPGLYVTGNLYLPKKIAKPLPTILYVCGHANVKENGISYGSKVHYQHHAAWFARNGYACLIIDTLQLGEIEGIHHGTYRYDRWWWLSRGYTPAGVEAWNCLRAIDYLTTRPEVDTTKIGVTGRSGGGIYSWWIAAIDERVQVAVPVAGITDMTNHVVDGCVEGHCDCMYMVNTYRWDYTRLPALVAPRPLLISNTDRDPHFPLDGVYRTYELTTSVYEQLNARSELALNITAGGHQDTQELRVHAFRWFNHYLQGHDSLIRIPAEKLFSPEQLRVFDELPKDEINTTIDEVFVPRAPSAAETLKEVPWQKAKANWQAALDQYVFNGWPADTPAKIEEMETSRNEYGELSVYRLPTDAHTQLPLFWLRSGAKSNNEIHFVVLDDENWSDWASQLGAAFPGGTFWRDVSQEEVLAKKLQNTLKKSGNLVLIPMRGAGPAKFSGDERKQVHIRRRYYLLGQTLHAMQTWDILQGIRAVQVKASGTGEEIPAQWQASATGTTASMLAYASLYVDDKLSLVLHAPSESHQNGPHYLNVMRYLDMPAALLMAADKHVVHIVPDISVSSAEAIWKETVQLSQKFPQLQLRVVDR